MWYILYLPEYKVRDFCGPENGPDF